MILSIIIVIWIQFYLVICAPSHSSTGFNLNDFYVDDLKFQLHELENSIDLHFTNINSGLTKAINFIRPDSSLIPSYFKFGEIDMNKNGDIALKDRTSAILPDWTSNNVYMPSEHNIDSVIKLHKENHGEHYMTGFIGDHTIERDGEKHKIISVKVLFTQMHDKGIDSAKSETSSEMQGLNRQLRQKDQTETSSESPISYADDEKDDTVPGPEPPEYKTGIAGRGVNRAPVSSWPEIIIVLDYNNSKHFNFDEKKVIDYVSVMVNSANHVFSKIRDPKITLLLTGVYITKSPDVEANWPWNQDGTVNHYRLLDQIAEFDYKNKNILPKHEAFLPDYAHGIAFCPMSCGFNEVTKQDMSASLTTDANGFWGGRNTFIHELGHNLGARHDEASPNMMFPECHWDKMGQGSCLQKNQTSSIISTGDLVVDRMDLKSRCKMFFPKEPAEPQDLVDSVDPDVQCRILYCNYPKIPKKQTVNPYAPFVPEDKTKCGTTGTCKDGYCIGDTPYIPSEKLFTEKCQEKVDARATYDGDAADPARACKNIYCVVQGKNFVTSKPFWFVNGASCGNGGTCQNGTCIGFKSYSTIDLSEKCKIKTGDSSATFVPEGGDIKDSCTTLRCKVGEKFIIIPFFLGEAFPCGKGGTCVRGKCVGAN